MADRIERVIDCSTGAVVDKPITKKGSKSKDE